MVTNMNAAKPGRNNCGSVLILEMSSRKALTSDNYVKGNHLNISSSK